MTNTNLILICVIVIFFICSVLYFIAKGKKSIVEEEDFESFEDILEGIKAYVVELTKENYEDAEDEKDYKKSRKHKAKINESLKNASDGDDGAKIVVKEEIIKPFVVKNIPIERVAQILGVDNESEPTSAVMFEIMMYRYKKLYGRGALSKWLSKYKFNCPRPANGICKKGDLGYFVTPSDEENSYFHEKIILSDEEKFDILTVLLYQKFKGFGMVDTILEMDIDGINIGCSGSVMDSINSNDGTTKKNDVLSEATNSLWLFYYGNYIHLQFLDFGSEDEIRRIVQLMIRFNSPGPLTAKLGFKVNNMRNRSRILALRPPAAEYWSAFVRKPSLGNITPEKLIIKEGVNNGEICVKLIQFLIRGLVTIGVTGRGGAGKTTLMKAIISYYDTRLNIGVLEMSPELYIREIYPDRNVISVQETETTSVEDLQDAFKKGDRAVTILGEVATDKVASRMIQLGMTGSLSTLFSHHANEAKDLVLSLRNSLVNAGGFDNMTTAEKQVTDVVKINIHMDMTAGGKRYIKRITEIFQLEEGIAYPKYDPNNKEESLAKIQAEYYIRQTDRISFITKDILTYDIDTDTYLPGEGMSEFMINKISSALTREESKELQQFINYYWKNLKIDDYDGVSDFSMSKEVDNIGMEENSFKDISNAVKFLSGRSNPIVEQFAFGDFVKSKQEE